MNLIQLTGNMGADPTVAYNSEGDPWAHFSLAVQNSKSKTIWVKTVCFNKLAEVCQNYLHKGARILVSGYLDQDKWQTEQGENRVSYKVIARNIEFIKTDGRGFSNGEQYDELPF